jgi:NADP-dependent 3-hydroxy acid dehydrogenase YdfG
MTNQHKSIAITGAGSGLGKAMALHFSRNGYCVAVTDASIDRARTVLSEIEQQGGTGFALALDVRHDFDWAGLYQRVISEWGGLDVLINNAGVAAAGRLEDSSIEDWNWVIDIDLMGVIRGCHRFIPLFREQGRGHIVNVASFAGMVAVPQVSAYATAKAGVVAVSEQLRVDLDRSGVGISVLCPSYVDTNLLETFRSREKNTRKLAQHWMSKSPITPSIVAEKVFKAVNKKQFLILTHPETRWAWRFKRWFPGRFHRGLVALSRHMTRKLET